MKKETMKVVNIPLSLIDRPAVPDRLSIDPEYIKELAKSIAEIGLQSPINLCPRTSRYEIVSGDCRYQAVQSLGWLEIPSFIKDLDAESVFISRATENLQRRDLTVIEEARIYRTLHNDHNMSWDQISKRTGKTPGIIKRRYDLLKMPEMLIKAMHEKRLSYAVAEELFSLQDLGKIEYYLGFCLDHGATVLVVKDWVKEERSKERQKEGNVGRGEWGSALPEQLPFYVPCEICKGPMEMSKAVTVRMCSECNATIKQNM